MSDKMETSQHKTLGTKIAVFGILILAVCAASFLLVMRQRAKTQDIICQNNLKRLGAALSLYAADHNNKLPPSWPAASKEIALPLKLHYLAGSENSPLSSIDSVVGMNIRSFYSIGATGDPRPDGGSESQKASDLTGLFVNATATPALLVCPADRNHSIANSWEELRASNITYEYVAQDAGLDDPYRVVCVCQIHPHVLHALLVDGAIQTRSKLREPLEKRNGHLYLKW